MNIRASQTINVLTNPSLSILSYFFHVCIFESTSTWSNTRVRGAIREDEEKKREPRDSGRVGGGVVKRGKSREGNARDAQRD